MFIPKTQSLLLLGLILLSATQAFSQQQQQIVATDANGNALSPEQLAALSQQAGNAGQQIVGVDQNGNEYAIPPEQLAAYLAQYQQGQGAQAQAQPQVLAAAQPEHVAESQVIAEPVLAAAQPEHAAESYIIPEPVLVAAQPEHVAQPQVIAEPILIAAQPEHVAEPQHVSIQPVEAAQPVLATVEPVTVAQPQYVSIQPAVEQQVPVAYLQPVGVPAEPTVTYVEPSVAAQPQVAYVEPISQQIAFVHPEATTTAAPSNACGANQLLSGQCCVDECPALSYPVNGTCKKCDNEHCILGSTKLYQCSADNIFKGELTVNRHIAQFHQLVVLSLSPVALASASACSKVSVFANKKLVGEFSTSQNNYSVNFNHDSADLELTFKCAASQTAKFSFCSLEIAVFECPNNYFKLNDISCTPACPAGTVADVVSRNCVGSDEQPEDTVVVQDPAHPSVVVVPGEQVTGNSIIISIPVVQEPCIIVQPDVPVVIADPIIQAPGPVAPGPVIIAEPVHTGGSVINIPGFNFTGGINLQAVLAGAVGVAGNGVHLGVGGANGSVQVPCAGSNVKLNLVHNVTQVGGVAAVPQDPIDALSADLSGIFGVNVNVLEGANGLTTKRNIRRGQ